MPVKYIHPRSPSSLFEIATKIHSGGDKDFDCNTPPWVIVGNVFASVSVTGNTSWEHVVADLHSKGQKDFIVLSGRHGGPHGSEFPGRGSDDWAVDPKGDRDTASRLASGKPGLHIEVKDVENSGCDSLPAMQSLIRGSLERNAAVILAWCYSFHAMKSGKDNSTQAMSVAKTKIADSFDLDWKYLESYRQLPAVQRAQAESVSV